MSYRAPLDDILFAMRLAAGDDAFEEGGIYADLAGGVARATLEEAAKFAEERLLPLDKIGDGAGSKFSDGAVTTPPGWREAYAQWVAGGWNSLAAHPDYGGLGLPLLLNAGLTEVWNSVNMAFAICPLLGFGAVEAVEAHASDALKDVYLRKMISGEWTATMNLTEPQAGSDLSNMRTRAEPQGDGSYRLFGQKIFITYGEHDLTDNIVHLVLARLPNAPPGTRGISLFLAPKFLPGPDGRAGARNDIRCAGIEHKLGVRGSPTCTMIYGDAGGATAFLVGEENKGLACMFTMMNNARIAVGLQGVALGERATQAALAYARERRQGHAQDAAEPCAIIEHPDVARMLMTMSAYVSAARAICYETVAAQDRARRVPDPGRAQEAQERASLLTPVAKAFASDIGNEVASLGVQVFGGMGFIEETGVAQILRDVRIAAIYEGTNGIQAIDLVTRKLKFAGGAPLKREIEDMRATLHELSTVNDVNFNALAASATEAVDAFESASEHLAGVLDTKPMEALAGAVPYLRLFALARGATLLGEGALLSRRENDARAAARLATARFFAENLAVAAPGLARTVMAGAVSVLQGQTALVE
jgi:acyl-CoA dehydrogenase